MAGGTIRRWTGTEFVPKVPGSLVGVTGLVLQLDASALGLADGTAVSSWPDSSGQGHSASSASPHQPTFHTGILNGLGGVEFAGSQGFDVATLGDVLTVNDNYSLFVVNSDTSFSSYPVMICYPTASSSWTWIVEYDPSGNTYWGAQAGQYRLYSTGVTTSQTPILALTKTTSTSGTVRKSGTDITTFTTNGAGMVASPTMTGPVRLGAYWDYSLGIQGYIFEALLFTPGLVLADEQRIEGYLAHKWGLAADLPAGHPYKVTGP